MREGAWIRIRDGAWWWIDEHASWMQREANANLIGLSQSTWRTMAKIPNDWSGPNRERILRLAMDEGFVRMRGHGDELTLEFTAETDCVLRACRKFLATVCGDFTQVRLNNLMTRESLAVLYCDLRRSLDEDDPDAVVRAGKTTE